MIPPRITTFTRTALSYLPPIRPFFSFREWSEGGGMREWLSLATAFALVLCINGGHSLLETCFKNSICLIFGNDVCTVNGNDVNSFVLPPNKKPKNYCVHANYEYLYARLDIEPRGLRNWNVLATFPVTTEHNVYNIEDFTFNFGRAELQFLGTNAAQITWNQTDGVSDKKVGKTNGNVRKLEDINSNGYGFIQYLFDIETPDVKLIDLIGEKITCTIRRKGEEEQYSYTDHVLNGSDFRQQLVTFTHCNVSEIIGRRVCYDSCNELDSNFPNPRKSIGIFAKPHCPSILWFHLPSESGMYRHWKKVENNLECHMGWWEANYTSHESGKPARGTHKFNSSEEIQCSAMHPEELTPQGKIVVGIVSGVGGLMGLAIVVLLILCLLRKRRKRNAKKFQFGADTLGTTSRAQTLGGKSTEREATQRALALKVDRPRDDSTPDYHTYENCSPIEPLRQVALKK